MIITQSLIKQLYHHGEELPYCPWHVYTHFVNHSKEFTSPDMEKGVFFETLCLGSGMGGKTITDLPRKVNGERSLDQTRIEEQHLRFEQMKRKYKIHVIPGHNTQLRAFKRWSEDVLLQCDFDIFPTAITTKERDIYAIIDIKLTKDIHQDYSMFSWNSAASIDPIQAYMNMEIATDMDPVLNATIMESIPSMVTASMLKLTPTFFFMIFDYSPKMNVKMIEVEYTPDKQRELKETIRKMVEKMTYHESVDKWQTYIPSYANCSKCNDWECAGRFIPEQKSTAFPETNDEFENIEYEKL